MRKARYANKRERYSRARNEFIVTIPVEEYRELVANNARAVFRLKWAFEQLEDIQKRYLEVLEELECLKAHIPDAEGRKDDA